MRSRTPPIAFLLLSHRCTRLLVATALLAGTPAFAARVGIDIQGLEGAMADAASANVALGEYEDRDVTPAEVRRLFEAGEAQILAALEPFGYYRARVHGELQTPEPEKFKAVYRVELGDPVIVRELRLVVPGEAAELELVRDAIRAFAPNVDDRLDHEQYEAAKALIDTRLKTAGYLNAKLVKHRVEVSRANNAATIDLEWDPGVRYRFGPVRFPDVQISSEMLPRYIPWREGAYYSTDLLLTLQQRLVDEDYFSAVSVQPALERKKDGVVPIDVLLVPAKKTIYSAEAFVSTDTGPGVRLGVERRWINRHGHKLGGEITYSQRLEEYALHYRIPEPGEHSKMVTFAMGYRDEETDTSRSRTARVAATQLTERWHGYTRTLGLQFLKGDFEIADEKHNSTLLYAEALLTQKRADDVLFPRHGRSLLYGVRFAPKSPLTDTTFAQVRAEAKRVQPAGKNGRLLLRAAGSAMAVQDFDDLPPELRFFTGGDRSIRGFDYQAIGEQNSTGGIIGGEYLFVASTQYEHYFADAWGAAVFVDAGDAFRSSFDTNVGTGIGLRWRSPVGLVRLDLARGVVTDLKKEFRIHLVIGPDLIYKEPSHMKWLRWTGIGLLALVLLLAAAVAWVLNSPSGTVTALQLAQRMLDGKLTIGTVEGTLAGPLTLHDLEFGDPGDGTLVSARLIRANVKLTALIRMTAHVSDAEIRGLVVDIRPSAAPPEPPSSEPFTLEPPIDIIVDRFAASDVHIRNLGEPVLHVTKAGFAGSWIDAGVAIKQLDVRSPEGEVHFTANVRHDATYVGEGRGSFRWQAGNLTYRGTLNANAQDVDTTVALRLSQPIRAQLNASLAQTKEMPWRFELQVPTFDPRRELMPDSTMASLGAALRGAGSLQSGRVTGQVLINGETLHVEPLQFARSDTRLDLEGTLRINDAPGRLRAVGHVQTGQEPATSHFKIDWTELVVPENWAGQVLHTRGELQFDGQAQEFTANGNVAIGPPDKLADIALRANGTSDAIRLEQFDIVQPRGRLAANGTVELKPQLGWTIEARAERFDPGAFAAQWDGTLDFQLASNGRMTDAGPDLKLLLENLNGRLRGRTLAGHADLQITPNKVLTGVFDLRSGASRLQVNGQPGEAIDAVVTLDVASLNDWLPEAHGRVNARYTINGRWPEIRIAGSAAANELQMGAMRAASLAVDLDVTQPTDPSGRAQVRATELSAAGFAFQQLTAEVTGNREAHRLTLDGTGDPLDTQLTVEGSLKERTWTGSVQTLMLDLARAAHLTLREPNRVVYSPEGTSISATCLQDGQIELCAAADLLADGSLTAKYSLRDVPLALANVFAPTLPLALEGTLQGSGDIRRDIDGQLFGRASISSPEGQIAQRLNDTGEEKQTMLRYGDLRLEAELSGPDAQASLHARLDEAGRLDGAITVNGLSDVMSPIRGEVSAVLPTLAPVALFVPQLANLSGAVDTRIAIAGTVQEPQLSGHVRATNVAADVPMLGLELREGRIEALPREDGTVQLAGGIRSGDGRLEFSGTATPEGMVQVRLHGQDFVAADIPSAAVIMTPDLRFQRAPEGVKLEGEVEISAAKVNLQKLPRGGRRAPRASSDVVVIDEQTTEEEVAAVPLEANITAILGKNVEITGFGLESRVAGRLNVRETPGQPTSGSGEIRIDGQYKAYGQDLTIRKGQVLYAGTPIDNPNLNTEAIREIEDQNVTAGLRITGSAQAPLLSVFSEPEMGEANALAFLVTGRPLDQVGEGDGDMLNTAARSLGTAAGGLVARNIGKRLGVDEVSVKESEALDGGAAFTVGQYLSPRLYLSYGVGLFDPGDVITLRYKLSKGLALQAERGPADTRAGVQYRVEK